MTPTRGSNGENYYSERELQEMSDTTMLAMAFDALNAMSRIADRLESVLAPVGVKPPESHQK